MTLPNFIIFGAIKSGTGALYQYLSHHPQIYCSRVKEPRFFSHIGSDGNGKTKSHNSLQITNLNDYERLFSEVKNEIAIGEASSNYINSYSAAVRIKEMIPEIRLIATLRNPSDRAYAHYRMARKNGELNEKTIESMRNEGWALTSMYFDKLKKYYDLFDKDQIKIIIFENWVNDVDNTLADLYRFLQVDESYKIDLNIKYTPGQVRWPRAQRVGILRRLKKYIPVKALSILNSVRDSYTSQVRESILDPKVRKIMDGWYREDILRLQSLIEQDLQVWLDV